MMKFFIHDFKDDINLFFQNYTYINNGWFPKENPVDTSEPNANGKQIKLKEQENDDQLFDCFWDETVLFGDFAENNILDDFDDMESLNCL
ncbi:hypothetical protein TRFO_12004 [Tritrichomonas foetus]|uniref:Uncharacterized protein n=1 Tax=Tritrichomonas foetus TaxID=1144522 RepID=A0A1J4J7K4_9EUKA|nr:hypothetical protein TRFO_12004 [Tritrichomonas foetus]|eukprot:OHS93188.1 hypothetical protein TRFO_12004 [Tritrichomonas foetus]